MPRQATKVLEARGTFKKDPKRRRPPEPQNKNPIGAPPDDFSIEQRQAWMDICNDCAPGVLSQSERVLVEMLSRLIANVRSDPDKVNTSVISKIESLLGRLGMTPADRPRVGVEPPKAESDFDGF